MCVAPLIAFNSHLISATYSAAERHDGRRRPAVLVMPSNHREMPGQADAPNSHLLLMVGGADRNFFKIHTVDEIFSFYLPFRSKAV